MEQHPVDDRIHKLYIESSTLCNLKCTMCMRNTWKDEEMGHMDFDMYQRKMCIRDRLLPYPGRIKLMPLAGLPTGCYNKTIS